MKLVGIRFYNKDGSSKFIKYNRMKVSKRAFIKYLHKKIKQKQNEKNNNSSNIAGSN